jgi:hypothetical protein
MKTSQKKYLKIISQAVIDGNLEIVAFLVAQGADINAQDNECVFLHFLFLYHIFKYFTQYNLRLFSTSF